MFNGKSILITGGTGSFGRECVTQLLANYRPERVIVFSRDEFKQSEMQADPRFRSHCMRYFLGDVRDRARLTLAFRGVDYVVHAAALKQVPAAEYNPHEFIKTNIGGATNIVDVAVDCGVRKVIAVSTDKAVNPINLYGATKLCADKVFVAGNSYAGRAVTRFAVVRYGNVIGSRGSVIPSLLKMRAHGHLTLTDTRMTRFLVSLPKGVAFVLSCMEEMLGGEIFVPKIPSCRIVDVIDALSRGCDVKKIGRRPGEKLHEVLIAEDDAPDTFEFPDHYMIRPAHSFWGTTSTPPKAKACPEGFVYASHTNTDFLSPARVREICREVARSYGLKDDF